MSPFNDNLKRIRISEIALILLALILIFGFFEIDDIWMNVIVIAYILFRCRKAVFQLPDEIADTFSRISFKTCLVIVVTNIILAIALGYAMDYLIYLFPYIDYMPSYEVEEAAGLSFAYLITFVDVVVIAPVLEEFIFRGIILNRLGRRIPIILAILLSSLLFGFLHGTSGFVSAFIFGVCACIVYLKTQNIFASISIHFLNNLVAMILEMVSGNIAFLESDIFIAVILILGLLSLAYIVKFIIEGYKEIDD